MNAGLFIRLVRLQFIPVMVMPVVLGASAAWLTGREFDPLLFGLVLLGAVSLHLAANAIDDVYDFANGVDTVSDRMFPRDAPGWKPVVRGMVSSGEALRVATLLYGLSLVIGVYLSLVVGWPALAIAIPGILLSYFYTAPPFKLDYRGSGLGEISIFLSFGPIPALGAYFVLAHQLSPVPVLLAVPSGLLTVGVLLSHDLIFYEPYKAAGKISLAVRLGAKRTTVLFTSLGFIAYIFVAALVLLRSAPPAAMLVVLVLPITLKLVDFKGKDRPPPEHGARTQLAFLQSVAFTGLLALGLLV